jgi:hypothetical protein
MVAGHRQHIADPAGFQPSPQPRVRAVDLVAGHPGCRDVGVQRAADHLGGQGRLGRKHDLVGDAGHPQAVGSIDPALGQVQLPVDQGMPCPAGVHQVDRDLGVLDPPSGAGVLALDPNGRRPLLEIAGLVHHQHRLGVAEVLDHIGAHVVADRVVVPDRPGQQVLHPVGVGVAGVLGDRPAVLARQIGQQPQHECPGMPAWLYPAKPARDPAQQLLQPCPPPGRGYAVACGHRLIFGCRHNTRSSAVAALVCSPGPPADPPHQPGHDLRLEY